MVDLRLVLISLSLEKDLSASFDVTGSTHTTFNSAATAGRDTSVAELRAAIALLSSEFSPELSLVML